MKPSFHSGFAVDIRDMMEWRGVLGYTESCYTQELAAFDRYCQKNFPDTSILTWEISLSYLNAIRERRGVRTDVAALRNLGRYQAMAGKTACIFPADYFSHKKRRMPYIMNDMNCSASLKRLMSTRTINAVRS